LQTKNILCKIGSKLYSILKNHKGQWVVLDSQGTTLGMVRKGSWLAWIEGNYQNKSQPMQLLTLSNMSLGGMMSSLIITHCSVRLRFVKVQ
jgi:hypothetical protein